MKVYNENKVDYLHDELADILATYRSERDFDASCWLEEKAGMLAEYANKARLKSIVIGISGGVDSAVALGIAEYAWTHKGGPRPIPVLLPATGWDGVTRQDDARRIGELVCHRLGLTPLVVDITPVVDALVKAVDTTGYGQGTPWSRGQVTATTRTPILYYYTSLLTENNQAGFVGGTTNLDEGGYLGFVGKASDGMVDVQLIADLHKSEVYAVGKLLRLPDEVLEVTPFGDMYDSRSDVEVFGAPYDAVELLRYALVNEEEFSARYRNLSTQAATQWDVLRTNLEHLHAHNAHKYLVGSPAYHLNIMDAFVPGGWK